MKLFHRFTALFLIFLCLVSLTACSWETAGKTTAPAVVPTGELHVRFLDVGQGDSALIQCGDAAMLIDAGERENGETVLHAVSSLGIDRLDYVIATHPHSDHIGGLPLVLKNIETSRIILPDAVSTTATYESLLSAIEESNIPVSKAVPGDVYLLGDASFTVLAPCSDSYDGQNSFSVVIRLVFGETAFLFTGDAESDSEAEMLENGLPLSADVLKVAHHGSSTSSSLFFLEAVNAKYAVISVGENNSYGHPKKSVLNRLSSLGATVYRTDENGTILCVSDGTSLRFETASGGK